MSETITVKPGQIWADNDKRQQGRTLLVERVDGDRALCRILTNRDVVQRDIERHYAAGMQDRHGKTVSVAVARMRPTSTGYRLVQAVDSGREG
jgi:hypothetical protein